MFDFVKNRGANIAEEARVMMIRLKDGVDETGGGAFAFGAGDADDVFAVYFEDKFELGSDFVLEI